MKKLWTWIGFVAAVFALEQAACASDPQARLKDAARQYAAGDTQAAFRGIRECISDPSVKEWMIGEAVRLFSARFRSPADSPLALMIFSESLHSTRSSAVVPSILVILQNYPALSAEEKLSILSNMPSSGPAGAPVLESKIQLLRDLGRYEPAVDLAAKLAQETSRLEDRILVVDLLLDLSRNAVAATLSNSILNDFVSDPAAYSLIAEKFYRHGDYRNALDIHRRGRHAFSNPMMFFDQSLSICQGLQLGREGIDLYLPVLSGGIISVPDVYREFLGLAADTAYLTQDYPAKLETVQNPNLYLAALPYFVERMSDQACLGFVRLYDRRFQNAEAHLELAEYALGRERHDLFQAVIGEIPDTPPDVAEPRRLLMFKYALNTQGTDAALAQYPPSSFAVIPMRSSVYRLSSSAFLAQSRLSDAIDALGAAKSLSPQSDDSLRLARMYYMAGRDSEALAAAYEAHDAAPSDETLYWLGWLSYLKGDTETARRSFRDAVIHSDHFLADEALSWLIAMGNAGKTAEDDVGRMMRDAFQGRLTTSPAAGDVPVAVQVTLCRTAIKSGLAGKKIPAEGSPYLQYLRWKTLNKQERTEAAYQDLLRQSPEFLRSLIRTEEP